MNFVGTLNAQIERRRTLGRIRDADVVIVAHLGRLGVARIRAALALAYEWDEVICGRFKVILLVRGSHYANLTASKLTSKLAQKSSTIEEIRIERRPIVEQQFSGRRARGRRSICDDTQQVLDHVVLERH